MSRPINADAAATKQRILSTAVALFAERGSDDVALRELAEMAEVSPAMIHHCFGGKGGLRTAAIDQVYSDLACLAAELVRILNSGSLPVTEIFDEAVRVAFETARRKSSSIRLLEREVVGHGGLDERRTVQLEEPFFVSVTERLSQLTGEPAAELRWPLHASIVLVARYAITNDDELMRITGTGSALEAAAVVQRRLCSTVRHLLRLDGLDG